MLAGNNFNGTTNEETNKIIINEAALSYYGFKDAESTIGKTLRGGNQEVTIKAVIKDFNQKSLKELPKPLAFFSQPVNTYYTIKSRKFRNRKTNS